MLEKVAKQTHRCRVVNLFLGPELRPFGKKIVGADVEARPGMPVLKHSLRSGREVVRDKFDRQIQAGYIGKAYRGVSCKGAISDLPTIGRDDWRNRQADRTSGAGHSAQR